MPDRVAVHLPSMLTQRSVYKMMVDECGDKQICRSQFYKLWEEYFPQVSIPTVSTDISVNLGLGFKFVLRIVHRKIDSVSVTPALLSKTPKPSTEIQPQDNP